MRFQNRNLKWKYVKNGLGFTITLLFLFFVSFKVLEKWHEKTVAKNATFCNAAAQRLLYHGAESIQVFVENSFLTDTNLSPEKLRQIDTVFTKIAEKIFIDRDGLEGGYYFETLDKFVGYAYPTSPPPMPVYGPPPRSYTIIKNQCLATIKKENSITELHNFDPAIFPLITVPILYKNKIVGSIWVRIHIEKDLPVIKLQSVVNIALIILIAALIIVLWFFYKLRTNIQAIQDELHLIHQDPEYRLLNTNSLFIGIVNSINQTLENLKEVNSHKIKLESQLLQKEKMASIGRIVAGVAHEVRTPLAIIKTRIQMWQQMRVTEKKEGRKKEYIDMEAMSLVVNETNRLSGLIKKLLMFSKPISKKMVLSNIPDLITEIVKILKIKKDNSNINFIYHFEQNALCEVDRNSIFQVFVNIITNAMEAMPDGGDINIETSIEGDNLRVEVIDQGIGIPTNILNRISELFVTSKTSGVGLGLSISNEIVKAHFGKLEFENLSQGGVKCSVTIPVKQQSL